jgi:hypothetical protein
MDGGKVVGLHSGGGFLWKNSAISGAAVLAFLEPLRP